MEYCLYSLLEVEEQQQGMMGVGPGVEGHLQPPQLRMGTRGHQ
jgi:hypothetical protein